MIMIESPETIADRITARQLLDWIGQCSVDARSSGNNIKASEFRELESKMWDWVIGYEIHHPTEGKP